MQPLQAQCENLATSPKPGRDPVRPPGLSAYSRTSADGGQDGASSA